MHLIINSLYKTREIFLRELISNASDALDKIRFLSLTDPKAIEDEPELHITISIDQANKALIITDTGIGMTRSQLIDNLGTIAKSGTSEFLAKMEQNKDEITQIGQFGVGFYSVFLVADKVTVASKSNDDPDQHVWMSSAVDDFTVAKDPRGNTLKRGSQITLFLKPDAYRFLEESALKDLIYKYSQFITFPIKIWSTKRVEDEDSLEETVSDWEQVNIQKPIWMREPKTVSDEEHIEFYKSMTRDTEDPLVWTHFKGEGETDFRTLLYVPSTVKDTFYDNIKKKESNKPLKLFVKRVFISDDINLLPRWLSFLKGIVDADDMPLNVSRETLQKHRNLRTITRHLIKKVLDMLSQLSESNPEQYSKFLGQYSSILKFGAIEDQPYRKKITSLLRYASSYNTTAFSSSLDDYIDRAKKDQKSIFYMSGATVPEIEQSPFVESLLARGYEILYFTDPLDETFAQNIPGYNGKQFVHIAKGDLSFMDDEDDIEETQRLEKEFAPLTDYLAQTLTHHVDKAIISRRLTTSPFAIVASNLGLSGHAERLLDAQGVAHQDPNMGQVIDFMRNQKKTLEINPHHPIIKSLLNSVEEDYVTAEILSLIQLLYETTAIRSGYPLKDVGQFARRVETIIRKAVGISLIEEAKYKVKKAKAKTQEEKQADEELKKTNIVYEEDDTNIYHDEL